MKQLYIILFLLLTVFLISCRKKNAGSGLQPIEVSIAQAVRQEVLLESVYTGQTYGESDIEINPRVNGLIQSIKFKEGTMVTKGQVLYTIDPLPYENKVDQAAGVVADANTYLVKAKADLDMIEPLAAINAVSQRELVSARAIFEAGKGKVQSAEAALRNAKIELSYCSIVAPISGLIGISKVRVGDYVSQGPFSNLNTISQLSDIRVRFTISEQEFMKLYRETKSDSSSLRNESGNIKLILSDGTRYDYPGKFTFADRQIDPATGAMTLEAIFPNPDKLLRPGQFVKVSLVTEILKSALLVPQRAVSEMQGIFQIYTLNDSNRVAIKIVKTGSIYHDAYVIEEGLLNDEKIILGGTQMLRPGMTVKPKETDWHPGKTSDDISD